MQGSLCEIRCPTEYRGSRKMNFWPCGSAFTQLAVVNHVSNNSHWFTSGYPVDYSLLAAVSAYKVFSDTLVFFDPIIVFSAFSISFFCWLFGYRFAYWFGFVSSVCFFFKIRTVWIFSGFLSSKFFFGVSVSSSPSTIDRNFVLCTSFWVF